MKLFGIQKNGRLAVACAVIFCLLISLVHACPPEYITAAGTDCTLCLGLDHEDNATKNISSHGDCHDCCSIKSCDDQDRTIIKAPGSFQFELVGVFPTAPDVVTAPLADFVSSPLTFDPGRPATGPPREQSSRAPPFFSLV